MAGLLQFFLGGHDLEMVTIRQLLERYAPGRFHDRGLTWGAAASAYCDDIGAAIAAGQTPVLIELDLDIPLNERAIIVVDHHGPRAQGQRTSLEQVFELLGLPSAAWSRWYELVATNDRGHIDALRLAGATPDEIVRVRGADRAAQGITAAEEDEGARAVAAADRPREELTVVKLAHNRTATVTDRLHRGLGGPGYDNLLIQSPGEVNFFGEGWLIQALDRAFPGGWFGGQLPGRGFWGHPGTDPGVLVFLLRQVDAERRAAVKHR